MRVMHIPAHGPAEGDRLGIIFPRRRAEIAARLDVGAALGLPRGAHVVEGGGVKVDKHVLELVKVEPTAAVRVVERNDVVHLLCMRLALLEV